MDGRTRGIDHHDDGERHPWDRLTVTTKQAMVYFILFNAYIIQPGFETHVSRIPFIYFWWLHLVCLRGSDRLLWDGLLVASVLEGAVARASGLDGEKGFEAYGNILHCLILSLLYHDQFASRMEDGSPLMWSPTPNMLPITSN